MSVGNLLDNGNKGRNFPFQFNLLELLGQIAANTAGAVGADYELVTTYYKAIVTGPGFGIGDSITRTQVYQLPAGTLITTLWFNQTTGLPIAAPPIASIQVVMPATAVTVNNLPVVLGQALMANSLAVTIASDQSAIPVTFPTAVRTPSVTRETTPGATLAGVRSITFANTGSANGLVLGTIIKSGETVSFSAGDGDTFGIITYDGTGTELLITIVR